MKNQKLLIELLIYAAVVVISILILLTNEKPEYLQSQGGASDVSTISDNQ